MTRIAYLVHNLADAAVARRITMFRAGGADVVVAGFCRENQPPGEVAGARAMSLGRTHDAALAQRAMQVVTNVARPSRLLEVCSGADVIVARNLEMLALARRARSLMGGVPVVYESLDIHRSLLGSGLPSRAMRGLERWLASECKLLLTSSPAFVRDYFAPVQHLGLPTMLVENKLLDLAGEFTAPSPPPLAGPPWTIGWFGNLRCRKTFSTLSELVSRSNGQIEVLIAGKASPAEFPDFTRQADRPGIRYVGPYSPAELPGLYARCHFAWAIDWFEEGLNSTWLLPNRLYEASAFGAVPIALGSVETGHWLAAHGAGLLLQTGAEAEQVADALSRLDFPGFLALRSAVLAIPRSELLAGQSDCRALVEAIAG